ncbi:hypothetical protein [Deinococcus sp.]|uniref:hypothetical protein n=1 Tax=Deinococcus sp. TaxID=47478 RepID=UPI003B596FB8
MTRRVTDLSYLEAQLQEVEERLKQAVTLLNNLKTIQDKFKDLSVVYKDARTNVDQSRAELTALKSAFERAIENSAVQLRGFEQRFTAHEKQNETRLGKLYSDSDDLVERTHARIDALLSELTTQSAAIGQDYTEFRTTVRLDLKSAEDNLQQAFRNLRGDVERNASGLRGDVETRLGSYSDELQTATKRAETRVQEVQTGLIAVRDELVATNKRLRDTQSSFSGENQKLLEELKVRSGQVKGLMFVNVVSLLVGGAALALHFVNR